MNQFGLAMIYLKEALRQPGCPICRCCIEHEERYLRHLLWENVNDLSTRARLVQSLGFCARHAQWMLRVEQEDLGMTLGNTIIYESLIHLLSLKVHDVSLLVAEQRARSDWIYRLFGWLGLNPPDWPSKRQGLLAAQKICRVCELSHEMAKHYGNVLVEMMSYEEFQDLYRQSDGICLPHLRVILQNVPLCSGLEHLLGITEERLKKLDHDLGELGRKYGVQYQGETVSTDEALSVERAIAFLTGSDFSHRSEEHAVLSSESRGS